MIFRVRRISGLTPHELYFIDQKQQFKASNGNYLDNFVFIFVQGHDCLVRSTELIVCTSVSSAPPFAAGAQCGTGGHFGEAEPHQRTTDRPTRPIARLQPAPAATAGQRAHKQRSHTAARADPGAGAGRRPPPNRGHPCGREVRVTIPTVPQPAIGAAAPPGGSFVRAVAY